MIKGSLPCTNIQSFLQRKARKERSVVVSVATHLIHLLAIHGTFGNSEENNRRVSKTCIITLPDSPAQDFDMVINTLLKMICQRHKT